VFAGESQGQIEGSHRCQKCGKKHFHRNYTATDEQTGDIRQKCSTAKPTTATHGGHLDVLEEATVESGAVDYYVAPFPLDEVAGRPVAGLGMVTAVVHPPHPRDGVREAGGGCLDLAVPAGLQVDGVPAHVILVVGVLEWKGEGGRERRGLLSIFNRFFIGPHSTPRKDCFKRLGSRDDQQPLPSELSFVMRCGPSSGHSISQHGEGWTPRKGEGGGVTWDRPAELV